MKAEKRVQKPNCPSYLKLLLNENGGPVWNQWWFKGAGAQEFLLSQLCSDEILMHIFHPEHKRAYARVKINELHSLFKGNRYLYEIVTTNRKRKLYFDIDSYQKDTLDECKEALYKLMPDAQLQISGYRPPVDKVIMPDIQKKWSYHITVSNYYFKNKADMEGVKGFCLQNKHLGFDPAVYTCNRLMKCMGQSKIDGPIQGYLEGSKSLKDHLISVSIPESAKHGAPVFEEYLLPSTPVVVNRIPRRGLQLRLDDLARENEGRDFYPGNHIMRVLYELNPSYGHEFTYAVAMYFIKKGYSFTDFWEWTKLKDSSEARKDKWANFNWPSCLAATERGENSITDDTILRLIERQCGHIRKSYYTMRYMDNARVNLTVDTKQQFCRMTDLNDNRINYLVFQMGSNKTGAICDYVSSTDSSCIFLNCRISLAQNLMSRLPSKFINYKDYSALNALCRSKEILGLTINNHTFQIKTNGSPLADYFVTTPNSLHFIGKERTYDILVIDEFEMFQTAWMSAETHIVRPRGGKETIDYYVDNWNTFKRIMRAAKKIIILDALPSLIAIDFLTRMGFKNEEIDVIGTSYEGKKLELVAIDQFTVYLSMMVKKLQENKKIYVFCPYKTPAERNQNPSRMAGTELLKYLEHHVGRTLKSKVYNGDTLKVSGVRAELLNVNQAWKDQDVIMVNQAVTIGVNFDLPDVFDCAFVHDVSFVSNRELVQTSRRIRHLASNCIYYCRTSAIVGPDVFSIEDLPDIPEVRENVRDLFHEKRCKSREAIKHMFGKNGVTMANFDVKTALPVLEKEYIASDEHYDYAYIDDITEGDEETYRRYCSVGAETIDEVLKLMKHEYQKQFDLRITPPETLANLWGRRKLIPKLADFIRMSRVEGVSHWIVNLFKYLGSEADIKSFMLPRTMKLSPEILLEVRKSCDLPVFERFKDMQVVSKALAAYFGTSVYERDPNHPTYHIVPDFIELLTAVSMFVVGEEVSTPQEVNSTPPQETGKLKIKFKI